MHGSRPLGAEHMEQAHMTHDEHRFRGYPADVADVLEALADVWGLRPPDATGKLPGKGVWIKGARALREACGEFSLLAVLQEEQESWTQERLRGHSYMVVGPQSLIGPCRARSALWRVGA